MTRHRPSRELPGPRFVLLVGEARARGFRNALAFRRWCRKRGVAIRTEGRFQWVNPADVDGAVIAVTPEGEASGDAASLTVDPVAAAVATLMLIGK